MQFSALVILACALASAARPHTEGGKLVDVTAPIKVTDVLNDNVVKIGNNILNGGHGKRGGLLKVNAPVTATNIGNGNKVGIANDILNGKGKYPKRDAVSVKAPVTIEEIFDCNTIAIANDILNNLALELGCTVLALGVTVEDILACNPGNWHEFVDKLNANKNVFSNMSKRDAVNVWAPVTIEDVLNCNTIEVANDILNHLAIELGCTIAELLITVEDILGAKDNWSAFVAKLKGGESVFHKRGGVADINIPITAIHDLDDNHVAILNKILNGRGDGSLVNLNAPVKGEYILNNNDVKVANDIANHHARRSAADVNAPVDANHIGDYNVVDILNKVADKRDGSLINVYAPITVSDVLNCNTIEIANNILNGLAAQIGCTVVELGITVEDILGCNQDNYGGFFSKLGDAVSKLLGLERRDNAVTLNTPITLENILNGNIIKILNDLFSQHGKRDAINANAPVNVNNAGNYNVVDILNKVGGKRDGADVNAPVGVSNAGNYNVVDILNKVGGKRDGADVNAPVGVNNVGNYNVVDILNKVGNGKRSEKHGALANVKAPVGGSHIGDNNHSTPNHN